MGEKEQDKEKNNAKNEAYSSFYSILSFWASFIYLIIDIITDNEFMSAIIALTILIVSWVICNIVIHILGKGIENDDKKILEVNRKLIKGAQSVGYLSYILLAITLIVVIIK